MYAQDASESSFLPWGILRVRRVAPRRSTSCCLCFTFCRWPRRAKSATSDPVNMTLPDNPSSRQDFTSKRKPPRSVCLPVPDTTTRLLSQRCKRAAVVESPKTERGRGRRKKHPRQSKTSSEPERLSATFQRSVPIPKRQFRIHKISETKTELALSLTNVAPSPSPSLPPPPSLLSVSLLVAA